MPFDIKSIIVVDVWLNSLTLSVPTPGLLCVAWGEGAIYPPHNISSQSNRSYAPKNVVKLLILIKEFNHTSTTMIVFDSLENSMFL